MSKTLQKIDLKIIDHKTCKAKHYPRDVPPSSICAWNYIKEHKVGSTCRGDSGGPMLVKLRPWNLTVVAGLTSWSGANCSEDKNHPTVFTRVNYYLEWIEEVSKIKAPLSLDRIDACFQQPCIEKNNTFCYVKRDGTHQCLCKEGFHPTGNTTEKGCRERSIILICLIRNNF